MTRVHHFDQYQDFIFMFPYGLEAPIMMKNKLFTDRTVSWTFETVMNLLLPEYPHTQIVI